jgi:hypothetical protein
MEITDWLAINREMINGPAESPTALTDYGRGVRTSRYRDESVNPKASGGVDVRIGQHCPVAAVALPEFKHTT